MEENFIIPVCNHLQVLLCLQVALTPVTFPCGRLPEDSRPSSSVRNSSSILLPCSAASNNGNLK